MIKFRKRFSKRKYNGDSFRFILCDNGVS